MHIPLGHDPHSASPFERLAAALDRLPNAFPRTASGIELRILERIFSSEEAALGALLTRAMAPIEEIAARAELSVKDARGLVMQLVRKGAAYLEREPGALRVRLAPFVVGFYEAQLDVLDHELAHLFEAYLEQGGAKGIMGPEPALQRVIPANAALPKEQILPYDDVRAILAQHKSFHVRDCICRVEQDLLETRRCDFPLEVCLSFSTQERPLGPGDLTREQALALLARTEEIGLVHSVSNVRAGWGYVCNCCGCCCGILRGITEFGLPNAMARANYYAEVDDALCVACGICVDRCQVGAMSLPADVAVVDRARCIGCGLCVTGCTSQAVRLIPLPAEQVVDPPADFDAWEQARLHHRGLL